MEKAVPCEVITNVFDPVTFQISSEPSALIVTVFCVLSIFLIESDVLGAVRAGGKVIMRAPLVASTSKVALYVGAVESDENKRIGTTEVLITGVLKRGIYDLQGGRYVINCTAVADVIFPPSQVSQRLWFAVAPERITPALPVEGTPAFEPVITCVPFW